jgi:hypothetical protein
MLSSILDIARDQGYVKEITLSKEVATYLFQFESQLQDQLCSL